MDKEWEIEMKSDEFGSEVFGEYDSPKEAYEALSRIALGCSKNRPEVERTFVVSEKPE